MCVCVLLLPRCLPLLLSLPRARTLLFHHKIDCVEVVITVITDPDTCKRKPIFETNDVHYIKHSVYCALDRKKTHTIHPKDEYTAMSISVNSLIYLLNVTSDDLYE